MSLHSGHMTSWRGSEAVAEECSRLLRDRPVGRLLDAGGGTGVLTNYLLGWHRIADARVLDPSEEALQEVPAGIGTRQGRIEDLRDRDGRFDTILLRQVLHYVDSPVAVLRRLRRRLTEGGILYLGQLTTPDQVAARWLGGVAQWRSSSRRRVWTPDRLLTAVAKAGFRLERGTLSPYWQPLDRRVPPETIAPGTHVRGTMPVHATAGAVTCRVLWLHAVFTPAGEIDVSNA